MKPGGKVTIHFDDLEYDGRRQNFAADPHWDATNNRATYRAREAVGAHDFGFSDTAHAGGAPGEVGGAFWRTAKWGYYADRVGPLSFDDRLEARGRVVFAVGGPDADMCFGWFRADKDGPSPLEAGDFIGIKVGGPTRVGHMFLPACAAGDNVRALPDHGPTLEPGRRYDWSFLYDPAAGNGSGSLTTTLGAESVTLTLKPDQRARAKQARLDHFGLFSISPGGQVVKLYLDDLHYTAAAPK
jgi:hypothetical protein